MITDVQLMREFVGTGSEEAFTELVNRYGGTVYAAALRQTADPHLAAEVTQAVFILLARKAVSISRDVVLIGWLMKVTQFACKDLLRSERRRLERETAAYKMNEPLEAPSSGNPSRLWDRIAPVLDGCLARLREADRHALFLRFFQNQSLGNVGAALGVAEDAARKRVNRALDKLRAELQREGVVTSPAILPGLLLNSKVALAPGGLVESAVSAALSPGAKAVARAAVLSRSVAWELTWSGLRVWFASAGVAVALLSGGIWAVPKLWDRAQASSVAADGDYRLAGFNDPRVVHRFIRDLQRELRAGERTAVAGLVRYPLRVKGRGVPLSIPEPAAMLSAFEQVFTESVAGEILKCPAQRLHCTADGVMIGSGSVWVAPEPRTGQPRIALVNLP